MARKPEVIDHYGAHYRDFTAEVYGDVRREAFGIDVGQNSWLTIDALDRFGSQLELRPESCVLDVGCGSGGPALHLAKVTGCGVVGVDVFEEAVTTANESAREVGLGMRARFVQADASQALPFNAGAFDALLCVDSINHLRDRASVLVNWARLLRPGGRLLFTDPAVVTGILDSDELAIRSSIGYFLFVPPGENERLLSEAGLTMLAVEDTTEQLAEIAQRRHDARAKHGGAVRQVEGDEAFEGRRRFFAIVATLARERRLSRFVYLAEN
jgi:SAM-dependent methyltransferase